MDRACGDGGSADQESPVINRFCGFGMEMNACFKFPQGGSEGSDLSRGTGFG